MRNRSPLIFEGRPLARFTPTLEVADDGGELGLKRLRAFKRVEHLVIGGGAMPDALGSPPLDLTRDQPAKRIADALGLGREPEVTPHLVGDLDPGLAIRDHRRSWLVMRGGSSAVSSSHGPSVARAPQHPFPYSRRRRTKGRSCVVNGVVGVVLVRVR
jgi:hypothetical protein